VKIPETSEEAFAELMTDAANGVKWAKKIATEMLEYADYLEEKAAKMRHVAALMIIEARDNADEIGELLIAEFPLDDDPTYAEDEDGPEPE
jgi:hypothetical protein